MNAIDSALYAVDWLFDLPDRFWRWRHRNHGGIRDGNPQGDDPGAGLVCECGKTR